MERNLEIIEENLLGEQKLQRLRDRLEATQLLGAEQDSNPGFLISSPVFLTEHAHICE